MNYFEYMIKLDRWLDEYRFRRISITEPINACVYIEKSTNRAVLLMFSETQKSLEKPIALYSVDIKHQMPEISIIKAIVISPEDYDDRRQMADIILKCFEEKK